MFKKALLFIPLLIEIMDAHIFIYNCYSTNNHTYINGRLIVEKEIKSNSNDSILKNIIQKAQLLFHSELKNQQVTAKLNSTLYTTISDDEGYFSFEINATSNSIFLSTEGSNSIEVSPIQYKQPKIGIISDFDDTLIVSNVPKKLKLLLNTLTKNYKQRSLVTKIANRVKEILSQNPKAPFIVVSGSPYQLYLPIKNFLNYHNFPPAIIVLKQFHGNNKDPKNQFKYKVQKIEQLFLQFPSTKWHLFGDSGEKDREIYHYLKQKYPKRVLSYSIRELK